jgi:LmbE family N-acetylglucosaminyl deacetylase
LRVWRSVLAVVAHPDDESFGLGASLATFAEQGAVLAVLCLTRGEASTLHAVARDLGEIRARELAAAAEVLGVSTVQLADRPTTVCGGSSSASRLHWGTDSSRDAPGLARLAGQALPGW